MRNAWLTGLTVVLGALAAYLLLWPVPIEPARWSPPEAPALEGVYAPNDALSETERIDVGFAPESVAVDPTGGIVCGLEDGSIVRWSGGAVEEFVRLDGRALGLAYDEDGRLIACDLYGRLLAITAEAGVEELDTEVDGRPLGLVNDVDIAADGTIYFSESSTQTTDTLLDLLEHRGNGRLLAYRPEMGGTDVLMDGLYYANGVAVSADGSFVLVVETTEYRVARLWLTGPRAGGTDVFVDNLPGFPDGISCDADGVFWLALMNPRNGFIDWALERPWIRKVAARLPLAWFAGAAPRYGFVLGLNEDGMVIHNLQDPSGDVYAGISCVVRDGDSLYFGSLLESAIGRRAAP